MFSPTQRQDSCGTCISSSNIISHLVYSDVDDEIDQFQHQTQSRTTESTGAATTPVPDSGKRKVVKGGPTAKRIKTEPDLPADVTQAEQGAAAAAAASQVPANRQPAANGSRGRGDGGGGGGSGGRGGGAPRPRKR